MFASLLPSRERRPSQRQILTRSSFSLTRSTLLSLSSSPPVLCSRAQITRSPLPSSDLFFFPDPDLSSPLIPISQIPVTSMKRGILLFPLIPHGFILSINQICFFCFVAFHGGGSHDCGFYVMLYAENFNGKVMGNFNQSFIPKYRMNKAYEMFYSTMNEVQVEPFKRIKKRYG